MRLVGSFAGQALVFVAMLISSFVALFCVLHAINAGTLSLSSWPLAQKSYHKSQGNKVAGSAWDGVGFNDTKGLLWFVHISDLHISKFRRSGHYYLNICLFPFCKKNHFGGY